MCVAVGWVRQGEAGEVRCTGDCPFIPSLQHVWLDLGRLQQRLQRVVSAPTSALLLGCLCPPGRIRSPTFPSSVLSSYAACPFLTVCSMHPDIDTPDERDYCFWCLGNAPFKNTGLRASM
jgi:hypothetical protein